MSLTNRFTAFTVAALVTSLASACDTQTDAQCVAALQASEGAPCENGAQCARPLICGAPRTGGPSVCHAAITCESNDECRSVHLCGMDTVCTANRTGMNACLPMTYTPPIDGGMDAERDAAE